ncbi:uncharacterized protein LOC143188666 isoform X2 [Calliopsis andreniformis]|uniref:uncharacterized protein LOC143188666 isoform X2 n=1 Tax=Calliopsis andreniformis TaxID=337506 RepID=UPI003FCE4812
MRAEVARSGVRQPARKRARKRGPFVVSGVILDRQDSVARRGAQGGQKEKAQAAGAGNSGSAWRGKKRRWKKIGIRWRELFTKEKMKRDEEAIEAEEDGKHSFGKNKARGEAED